MQNFHGFGRLKSTSLTNKHKIWHGKGHHITLISLYHYITIRRSPAKFCEDRCNDSPIWGKPQKIATQYTCRWNFPFTKDIILTRIRKSHMHLCFRNFPNISAITFHSISNRWKMSLTRAERRAIFSEPLCTRTDAGISSDVYRTGQRYRCHMVWPKVSRQSLNLV